MKTQDLINRLTTVLEQTRYPVSHAATTAPASEKLTLPALVIRIDRLTLDSQQSADAQCTLTVIIQGIAHAGSDATTALLDLVTAIRIAVLTPGAFRGLLQGGQAVQMGTATFRFPDLGQSIATVDQPVTFTLTERYAVGAV